MTGTIEILRQTTWLVHWGGICQLGGTEGHLSECRLAGVVFYVRESVELAQHGFGISSGERMALKRGQVAKRHQQILELACARPADFDRLAAHVHAHDHLARPVRSNRLFTVAWARRQLARRREPDHA
jgi:hypothetical protein